MTLDKTIEMFVGQDGEKNLLEVKLSELREWQAEMERLRGVINGAVTETCRNEKCPRGGVPVTILAPAQLGYVQSELLQRLRLFARSHDTTTGAAPDPLLMEAADEIERLEAALRKISDSDYVNRQAVDLRRIAAIALRHPVPAR